MKNARALYNGMNIIVDAFEKRVFMTPDSPDVEARSKSSDTNDKDGSKFETPREVTLRSVISDFNVDRLCKDRDKDEQPDTIDLFELESDQHEQGLKILTQDQMLKRLSISLAQANAGNNSEKIKNKIKQILYSLYRSKKLTKQLYKSLIDTV